MFFNVPEKLPKNIEFSIKNYLKLAKERPHLFENPDKGVFIEHNIGKLVNYCHNHKVKLGVVFRSKTHYIVHDLVHNGNSKYYVLERMIPIYQSIVIYPRIKDKTMLIKEYNPITRKEEWSGLYLETKLENEKEIIDFVAKEIGAVTKSATKIKEVEVDPNVSTKTISYWIVDIVKFKTNKTYSLKENFNY